MRIAFGQLYIDPQAYFPFSIDFQLHLSKEVSKLTKASPKFIQKYGKNFQLIFRISARKRLSKNDIRGPMIFRKDKDVEYSVYLPYKSIMQHAAAPKVALAFLFEAVVKVLDDLEIDTSKVRARQAALISDICSDPKMLDDPPWDEEEAKAHVERVFRAFFAKRRRKQRRAAN